MKFICVFYLATFGLQVHSAFSQNRELFVGEIHGKVLDSFKKNEIVPYKNFGPPISASAHRIEIRLYETELPMGSVLCTILTFDTIFKRTVARLRSYDDSSEVPEVRVVSQKGLDEIFEKIVSSGIFSITMINRGEVKIGYQPMILSPKGLDTTGTFHVSDGALYFLEFKVDKYYDQEFFENPAAFSDFYKDNQTLRRQKEIVTALTDGIYY
jgi:hypothetical protein